MTQKKKLNKLDKAIKHCYEVANSKCDSTEQECKAEHLQLANG